MDVGTGSGCLAITAAMELTGSRICAVDISDDALGVAHRNARNHDVSVKFYHGDLLEPIPLSAFQNFQSIVLANLPYVPDGLVTSPEITHEPAIALFAGADGLDIYQAFWDQISARKYKPLNILTESLESQHFALIDLAAKSGYNLAQTSGLIQHFSKAHS